MFTTRRMAGHGMSSIPTFRQGRTVHIGDKKGNECTSACFMLMVFICSVLVNSFVAMTQWQQLSLLSSFYEVKDHIVSIQLDGSSAYSNGFLGENEIVHFSTDDFTATVKDPPFAFGISDGLKLKRYTEYCQWSEIAEDKCKTCTRYVRGENGKSRSESYPCSCVRVYRYLKTWHSHLIPSLLFNQPGAHFNPMRDPYPSTQSFSTNAVVGSKDGGIHLATELIKMVKGRSRKIVWTRDAKRQEKWYDWAWIPFSQALNIKDSTRYESISPTLDAFLESEARRGHAFSYVGEGYFFSPYEESMGVLLLKKFVQWREGSLLDYQFGDIVPSCTAGDIRVSYYVIDPPGGSLSGLGKLVRTVPTAGAVGEEAEQGRGPKWTLDLHTTRKGRPLGLLRAGSFSASALMDAEAADSRHMVYLSRALHGLWALLPANLMAVYFGYPSPSMQLLGCTAVAITGLVTFVSRGLVIVCGGVETGSMGGEWGAIVVGALVSGAVLAWATWTMRHTHSAGRRLPGGGGAVFRCLARATGAPPTWYEAPSNGKGEGE